MTRTERADMVQDAAACLRFLSYVHTQYELESQLAEHPTQAAIAECERDIIAVSLTAVHRFTNRFIPPNQR